jgi:serine phosphatase RsbU (regulator of sigma subunit)
MKSSYHSTQEHDVLTPGKTQGIDDHLASLRYAGIIQKALLPDPEFLKSVFKDYFVLFMPRNIVSGDFYYVTRGNQYLRVAAGDCTGHGVPGALLTILGIGFLNDIFQSRIDIKANRALNLMREKLMKALRQTGEKAEAKDSIDLALCIFDTTTGQLQFSGANRPLILMRNGELIEYKPDKMTIGLAPLREHPFTNQVIDIKPGDSFYLFSDGYPDQFGEMNSKKFKQKNLKRIISSLAGQPMYYQKEIIEGTFREWKGNEQQVDDVLVFGFQL